MLSDDIKNKKSPEIDVDKQHNKMTSKLSDFLRTFQHHQSLSMFCIDEVRFKLRFITNLILINNPVRVL